MSHPPPHKQAPNNQPASGNNNPNNQRHHLHQGSGSAQQSKTTTASAIHQQQQQQASQHHRRPLPQIAQINGSQIPFGGGPVPLRPPPSTVSGRSTGAPPPLAPNRAGLVVPVSPPKYGGQPFSGSRVGSTSAGGAVQRHPTLAQNRQQDQDVWQPPPQSSSTATGRRIEHHHDPTASLSGENSEDRETRAVSSTNHDQITVIATLIRPRKADPFALKIDRQALPPVVTWVGPSVQSSLEPVKKGDTILEIDGVKPKTQRQARDCIKRATGTSLRLLVRRDKTRLAITRPTTDGPLIATARLRQDPPTFDQQRVAGAKYPRQQHQQDGETTPEGSTSEAFSESPPLQPKRNLSPRQVEEHDGGEGGLETESRVRPTIRRPPQESSGSDWGSDDEREAAETRAQNEAAAAAARAVVPMAARRKGIEFGVDFLRRQQERLRREDVPSLGDRVGIEHATSTGAATSRFADCNAKASPCGLPLQRSATGGSFFVEDTAEAEKSSVKKEGLLAAETIDVDVWSADGTGEEGDQGGDIQHKELPLCLKDLPHQQQPFPPSPQCDPHSPSLSSGSTHPSPSPTATSSVSNTSSYSPTKRAASLVGTPADFQNNPPIVDTAAARTSPPVPVSLTPMSQRPVTTMLVKPNTAPVVTEAGVKVEGSSQLVSPRAHQPSLLTPKLTPTAALPVPATSGGGGGSQAGRRGILATPPRNQPTQPPHLTLRHPSSAGIAIGVLPPPSSQGRHHQHYIQQSNNTSNSSSQTASFSRPVTPTAPGVAFPTFPVQSTPTSNPPTPPLPAVTRGAPVLYQQPPLPAAPSHRQHVLSGSAAEEGRAHSSFSQTQPPATSPSEPIIQKATVNTSTCATPPTKATAGSVGVGSSLMTPIPLNALCADLISFVHQRRLAPAATTAQDALPDPWMQSRRGFPTTEDGRSDFFARDGVKVSAMLRPSSTTCSSAPQLPPTQNQPRGLCYQQRMAALSPQATAVYHFQLTSMASDLFKSSISAIHLQREHFATPTSGGAEAAGDEDGGVGLEARLPGTPFAEQLRDMDDALDKVMDDLSQRNDADAEATDPELFVNDNGRNDSRSEGTVTLVEGGRLMAGAPHQQGVQQQLVANEALYSTNPFLTLQAAADKRSRQQQFGGLSVQERKQVRQEAKRARKEARSRGFVSTPGGLVGQPPPHPLSAPPQYGGAFSSSSADRRADMTTTSSSPPAPPEDLLYFTNMFSSFYPTQQ